MSARAIDSRITLAESGSRRSVVFVLLVAAAHTVTYFVAGAVAFTTLTHTLYEGVDPLFGAYLRTPGEPDLWQHVTTWFLPAQLLRGVLMGLALSPILPQLRAWSVWRRTAVVSGLYLILGFWAAAVAAPGNIEGQVYLRPALSGPDVVLLVQPEIFVQGVVMAILVAIGVGRLLPAPAPMRHRGREAQRSQSRQSSRSTPSATSQSDQAM
jgi:hypothetical protein